MTTVPSPRSSTSDEPPLVQLTELCHAYLGQRIRVMGRNVTLGPHQAPPLIQEGVLEAVHMNSSRVRVTINPGKMARRIVEVTE